MTRLIPLVSLALCLCACKPAEEGHLNAIIGAVLIDGQGGPPLTNSVVLVSGDRIRAVGPHSVVPIPSDADKIDGYGKYLVPALVDICDAADPAGSIHAATPDEARTQVARLAARKVPLIHIAGAAPEVSKAVMAAAREASIPVAGHIATQAEARSMVDAGASVLIGMVGDTEDPDPVLLTRLRDLRIVVAPSLGKAGSASQIAGRNTRRFFQAGILLGLASEGGDPIGEAERMVQAGVPPLDVIVASTQNGARALRQLDLRGAILPDHRADLVLLSANPGDDVANLRKVALRMDAGAWIH